MSEIQSIGKLKAILQKTTEKKDSIELLTTNRPYKKGPYHDFDIARFLRELNFKIES